MTEFNDFMGEPLSNKFAQVDAVKVVFVLSNNKIYYINDRYAHLHYDFCKQFLNEYDDLALFNKLNYSQDQGRKYLLGNINFFHSTKKFALEFSVADDISAQQILTLYHEIKKTFIPDVGLSLYVNTPLLMEKVKKNNIKIPTLEPNEVYSNQTIQVVNQGQAYGKFRKVKAENLSKENIDPDDILLIEGYSNDIPLCAGVIITTFQTPLSHITILAHNRKTPVIAYKNASSDEKLEELIGQQVLLSISSDTFKLSVNEKIFKEKKKKKSIRLSYDLNAKELTSLNDVKFNDIEKYGAKVCYLAELQRVKGANKLFYTPRGGFTIPFYFYYEHIKKYGIDNLINSMLSDSTILKDAKKLNQELNCIRDSIISSPIDAQLLEKILEMIEKNGTGKRPRFRSSSNAEDLDNFNGAGLYDSKTGIPGDTTKPVDKAIKKVWASLWNERAFREREYFQIDHHTVFMGILVHESFPDEISNGVAVTRNLYRDTEAGYIINMQLGETSVVQPPEGVTTEWMITYLNTGIDFYDEKGSIEYMSYSSLNNNKPILNIEQVKELTDNLSIIKNHFYTKSKAWVKQQYRDYALDIEFKYVLRKGQPVLIIKQARPYR